MLSRREAREAVVGLAFELGFHGSDTDPQEILENAKCERNIPDDPYIEERFMGICNNLTQIDSEIEKHSSGWRVDRISRVSLAILRLAVYEMVYASPKLPRSIAINEAVEICKTYAEEGAAPFVNGILNTLAKANGCEA